MFYNKALANVRSSDTGIRIIFLYFRKGENKNVPANWQFLFYNAPTLTAVQ